MGKRTIEVLVVDDHALFRAGLVSLLTDLDGIGVVGEARNGKEALELLDDIDPDLILLDVNMPLLDGVEALKLIKKTSSAKVLMLTISRNDTDLFGAIQAGADGYILKNSEPSELENAIHLVMDGKSILSPEITKMVMEMARDVQKYRALQTQILTNRESQVIKCLAKGMTTAGIANDLFISENTVKTHVRHLLEKLDASNRAEAVSKAERLGLIGLKDNQ